MEVVPYIVATRPLQARLNLDAAGPDALVIDPRNMDAGSFIAAVGKLDSVIYGARGLDLPRWALYDCAAIPGLITGWAARSAVEAPEAAKALRVPELSPMAVPLSRGIALPALEPGKWLAWSISDVAKVLPAAGPDRREQTLALLMELLGTGRLEGLTQWTSSQLDVFMATGALRLRAAWLPAHSLHATAVFEREDELPKDLGDTVMVEPMNEDQLRGLQAEIESGITYYIVGERDAATGSIPIAAASREAA